MFFLYSFKAVARIDSGGSGRIGTWERKEVARDLVQLTASWIIEWSECLWAKAVKGGRLVPLRLGHSHGRVNTGRQR